MKRTPMAWIGALLAVTALAGRSEAANPAIEALEKIAHADSARAFMLTAPRGSQETSGHYRQPLLIRAEASVDSSWQGRMARALGSLGPYQAGAGCPKTCDTCRDERMAGIRFFTRAETLDVLFFPRAHYAGIRSGTGPIAFTGFTRRDSGVVDLLRRAFPPKKGPASDSVSSAAEPREFCAVIYEERVPEAVQRVAPEYPTDLSKAGVEGTVQVKALVGRDGIVKDVVIDHSIPALDAYAARAVRQWFFRPATCNGEPVAVWVVVPVQFKR